MQVSIVICIFLTSMLSKKFQYIENSYIRKNLNINIDEATNEFNIDFFLYTRYT